MIIDKEERNETWRWKIIRTNHLILRNFKKKEGKGNYTEILENMYKHDLKRRCKWNATLLNQSNRYTKELGLINEIQADRKCHYRGKL